MLKKHEVDIPMGAASRNLIIALCALAIGFVMLWLGAPTWLYTFTFGVSGVFMISMVRCILDIQEFKMKQNQKIVELLANIVNSLNNY